MTTEDSYVAVARVSNVGLAVAISVATAGQLLSRRGFLGRVITFVGVLLVTAAVSTIRILADQGGLEVGFGPWGWPRRRIDRARIVNAHVAPSEILRFGGYGYRVRGRHTRVIVRSGPTLVVDLVGGGTFGVTVPDADGFVDVLNR